ncbi:MAG: methionine biosynthesis protein MetW [Bryobacteraceae bacterium]|nr:methionine biosynthesis protein MetW [Bryobacteraceae bacterium]
MSSVKHATPDPLRSPFVRELLGRSDYAIISELIEPSTRVLDLGCGEGELLEWLQENKNVEARGVELNGARVQKAIARGVSVYQGNIDNGLNDYPDNVFDYIILSQTLQEVREPLRVFTEMLRVGKRVVVAFPNFGHWRVRLSHLWSGRAPRTRLFPYEWYNSPNIHFLTVDDFVDFAVKHGFVIERKIFLSGNRRISFAANLFAETAVFLLRR